MNEAERKLIRQKMLKMVELYLNSGNITQVDFCRQHNLKYKNFKNWLHIYRKEILPNKQKFIPITEDKKREITTPYIHINYPNGISIDFPLTIPVNYLKTLLHLI